MRTIPGASTRSDLFHPTLDVYLVWTALVNGLDATGLGPTQQTNDIVLIVVTGVAVALGFGISFFRFGIQAGSVAAGVVGGLALGFRIVTLKDGLLIPIYPLNWIPIVLFGILGLIYVYYDQRMGVVRLFQFQPSRPPSDRCRLVQIVSTSSIGSFLIILCVDLIVNGVSGFSRGLRFLLDRNLAHAAVRSSLSQYLK